MSKYWSINGEQTSGIVGSHPTITVGETASFEFRWTPQGDPDHLEKYQTLQDKLEYVDRQSTGTYITGKPWYRELHDRETLLLKLEPGSESEGARGVWGLLVGGSDNTVNPADEALMTLEVLVLAEVDEYDSQDEVEDEFLIDTDVATYQGPDSDEGPFLGGAEEEPESETYPSETQDDVEDDPTSGDIPDFTVTLSDLTVELQDEDGEITEAVEVSVDNDLGEEQYTGSTDTGSVTARDLRSGLYEVEGESDFHRRTREEVEIEGSDKTFTLEMTRLPGADDQIDVISDYYDGDIQDYCSDVQDQSDYDEHEDFLVNTVGLSQDEAETYIDQLIENIGTWDQFTDWICDEASDFDEHKEETRDEKQPGEGDVGGTQKGIEFHSNAGTARDGTYIDKSNWVEIFGSHIHHARAVPEDNDTAEFTVSFVDPPTAVTHDQDYDLEVEIENTSAEAIGEKTVELDPDLGSGDSVTVDLNPNEVANRTLTWTIPEITGLSYFYDVTVSSPDDSETISVEVFSLS